MKMEINTEQTMIDHKLLALLVCPETKAPVKLSHDRTELICKASGLAYPIKDGMPVMLKSEARVLSIDEKLSK